MSLTLSVTSSSTLFATNIPSNAGTLLFESSADGTTYTTIQSVPASPISIPVGTSAYSLTVTLIPSFYYRVTAVTGGQTATTQYILRTQGATGSSTSSFSNSGGTGNATIGSTTITMNPGGQNSVLSDQTYSATQAVYFQMNTPTGTSMGNATYTMALYNPASGVGNASTRSAYFQVTTSGSTTTVTTFRGDGATATSFGTPTTISANPTNLVLYWDGTNTIYYYIGGSLITTYTFSNAWATVRGAIQMTTTPTIPITLSDVRLYVTGKIASANNWRLILANVTGTSLSPTSATYGTYYYITNTGFNSLTLPNPSALDTGAFWVLRNNTSSYLSVGLAGTFTGLTSPLIIPPSNSVTIVWAGSSYVLF